ncbi:hypothetical protein AQUCO_01500022v1 [Aquilegia coerulea]|uniref:NAC domain-containing protein n=1 Tax=Aquilegia coerulea TaxID=218851 RepID=A0A2G5DRS5_AQUCA|nr:hypothetical protein AQUCO_01500022v1 [Aquilegia coerulea]PIA46213.1 hypothetical protein AQUCO_01500022v1 [Aquilegia coerulea]
MGDLNTKNPKSPPLPPPPPLQPPLSLSPGYRFHPTEQQILSYYLSNKNKNPTTQSSIPEINDLYNYDPYDLVENDSFPYGYGGNKKHWYYFTILNRKGSLVKRKSKAGFWKRKCKPRNVLCGNDKEGILLGTKTSFVFYKRDSSSSSRRCCRTNWIMIEYALVDHQMDFFVLCRVYLKTCPENKVMKVGLNSHAEESFAVKDSSFAGVPYRQHNGASALGIGEVVVHEDTVRPFSDNGVGSSLDVRQSDKLVIFDENDMDELRTNAIFLEGDYLELDDLVGPLFGFGSSG